MELVLSTRRASLFSVLPAVTIALFAFGGGVARAGDVRAERLELWNSLSEPAPINGDLRFHSQALMLPVEGVAASTLRDSFDEPRSSHRRHAAIDIMAPRNTPVLAAVDGVIRKLTRSALGGITIYEIDESGRRVYYYAHLQRYLTGLREGQRVARGEVIGYVGSTGNAKPGAPHLHFAIKNLPSSGEYWQGVPVDPYPLLVREVETMHARHEVESAALPSQSER